ncbi:hypothetical protein J6A31_08235 [bacterium]|nr:hypothetical protein [bacterium]
MREKVSVSAKDIDSRVNQRAGDYEDLAADLRNREVAGQRAQKEFELEKAEQAATKREQAYIDKTYGTTHKSASESADVFNEDFAKKEAEAKAKEEAKKPRKTILQTANTISNLKLKEELSRTLDYYKSSDMNVQDVNLNTVRSPKEMINEVLDKLVYTPRYIGKPVNPKAFLENIISNSDNKIKNLSTAEIKNFVEQGIPGFSQLENADDIIKLLKNVVDNPEYKNLSRKSQTMLKFATLLTYFDSETVKGILKEYKVPDNIVKRINLFNYNNYRTRSIAALYINDEDLKIHNLLTEEKLKIDSFNAKSYNQEDANKFIDQTRSRVQLVYSNQITNKKQMPELTIKGMLEGEDVTVKYLDLTAEDTSFDLTAYGFEAGTNKDNLRVLAHMFGNNNSDPLTSVINILNATKDNNGGITLSTTLRGVTGRTFGDAGKIGVLVSGSEVTSSSAALHHGFKSGLQKKDNVYYDNLVSGTYDPEHKGYYDALKSEEEKSYLNEFEARDKASFFLADNLVKKLNSMGYNITNNDYSLIVEQLSSHKYISNIKDDIKVGDITIKATDLQEAITETQDLLIKTGDNPYNEVLVNTPKIQAIVLSDYCDMNYVVKYHPSLLVFAEKYVIPIIKVQ